MGHYIPISLLNTQSITNEPISTLLARSFRRCGCLPSATLTLEVQPHHWLRAVTILYVASVERSWRGCCRHSQVVLFPLKSPFETSRSIYLFLTQLLFLHGLHGRFGVTNASERHSRNAGYQNHLRLALSAHI